MRQAERYVRNQANIKGRAIYAILRKQKALLADMLDRHTRKSEWKEAVLSPFEQDATTDDAELDIDLVLLVSLFVEETKTQIPDYLLGTLPRIMEEGAKAPIEKYKDSLPDGYTIHMDFRLGTSFDIETDPVAKYFTDLKDLMLSQRKGSINKTSRDRIRKLLADGINNGYNPQEIAKQIRAIDPFVFSQTRAMLIATNECGRAFGYGNFIPVMELHESGTKMMKKWITKMDKRVCPTCLMNQGEGWIPADRMFESGDMYAPSGTMVRCRCFSTYQTDDSL